MKSLTINVPNGTEISDRHGIQVQNGAISLHMVAPTREEAIALGVIAYAAEVKNVPLGNITASETSVGSEFAKVLARAVDISGTINIEGGVLIERTTGEDQDVEVLVRAKEEYKVRWVRLADERQNITPIAIVERLQEVF